MSESGSRGATYFKVKIIYVNILATMEDYKTRKTRSYTHSETCVTYSFVKSAVRAKERRRKKERKRMRGGVIVCGGVVVGVGLG